MACESYDQEEVTKISFEQEDVFVHTAVPASTFYDNIIRGKLSILEKASGVFVEWNPSTALTQEIEFEIHSLVSGPIEYGLVTTQKVETQESDAEENKSNSSYNISFNIRQVLSVRRSDPRLAWSYVVFILKNGETKPALHFHNGGIEKMISTLQRYIWLARSPTNPKLFLVQKKDEALGNTLSQFDLAAEKPVDTFQKFLNTTYYGTLNMFSKVTQNVMSSLGQETLQERRPTNFGAISNSNEQIDNDHLHSGTITNEYEFLQNGNEPDRVGPIIPGARSNPLQPEEWCCYMDDEGRINDVQSLKAKIYRGGIHPDIRKEAWKYLLGYRKFDQTYEERIQEEEEKRQIYETVKNQWSTIYPKQESRFTEFSHKKQLIEKDVNRTDRLVPFYSGDNNENVKKLFNILMTYCMYNFDLGYVQGMSDLLSPILLLLEDEVEAFWCFSGLMEKEEKIFEATQSLMKDQLSKLSKLIQYLYPHFSQYLASQGSENLYFCFRWLIISFKRDFNFDDLMTLWEACWTQTLTPYFKLFICAAILEREKDYMMKNNFDFNDILKHVNELAYKIDLNSVLARAESLCLQIKNTDDLPEHIKELVACLKTDESENESENTSSSSSLSDAKNSTVELNESTQSIF